MGNRAQARLGGKKVIDTSHQTSFDYDEATDYAHEHAEWRKSLAEQYKYVFLVPAIARAPEYYTVDP